MSEDSPNYIRVKVNPGSSRSAITGSLEDGTIKISLKSNPEKGKANQELIKLLSEHYQVNTNKIRLISGHTSQIKLIRILD